MLEINRFKKIRVNAGDVITLNKVIGIDLPVGVEHQAAPFNPLELLDLILPDFGQKITELGRQIGGFFYANKHQSPPDLNR